MLLCPLRCGILLPSVPISINSRFVNVLVCRILKYVKLTMRVRAVAAGHTKSRRFNAAYHASSNTRHTSQAGQASDQLVLQDSPYVEHDINRDGIKFHHQRLKRYLRHCLPFDNFSSSLYSVPMLLLLRLFYSAAPYATQYTLQKLKSELAASSMRESNLPSDKFKVKSSASDFMNTYAKIDVCDFRDTVNAFPELADAYTISTLTWVKALASPLSHEYLQIIISHAHNGQRYRLVTDRSDVGDTVIIGWDWSSEEYASHHHVLPLPLLSLSFENNNGPSLDRLSTILTDTSKVQGYNLLREMCWWYAERVFTQVAQTNPAVIVKQWPYASLRYSFVVQNEWVKRPRLVKEAEAFRASTRTQMLY